MKSCKCGDIHSLIQDNLHASNTVQQLLILTRTLSTVHKKNDSHATTVNRFIKISAHTTHTITNSSSIAEPVIVTQSLSLILRLLHRLPCTCEHVCYLRARKSVDEGKSVSELVNVGGG